LRSLHRRYPREHCPERLRHEAIRLFNRTCQHCGRPGSEEAGPDDRPWHVDRLVAVGRRRYEPTNVTLACARCNLRRGAKPAPRNIRSLADLRARPTAGGTGELPPDYGSAKARRD
jgi:5-methylcytosine-specific restriction endonuclease McrA